MFMVNRKRVTSFGYKYMLYILYECVWRKYKFITVLDFGIYFILNVTIYLSLALLINAQHPFRSWIHLQKKMTTKSIISSNKKDLICLFSSSFKSTIFRVKNAEGFFYSSYYLSIIFCSSFYSLFRVFFCSALLLNSLENYMFFVVSYLIIRIFLALFEKPNKSFCLLWLSKSKSLICAYINIHMIHLYHFYSNPFIDIFFHSCSSDMNIHNLGLKPSKHVNSSLNLY